ncbi:MAG: hypothetical protein AB7I41_05280 [Candidatus Sericytochromatia bacterium]
MSFLLFFLYLLGMGIEAYMFHTVLEGAKGRSIQEVLVDIFSVNMVTLVIVVLVLGRVLAELDFDLALASSFRTAMIVLPQSLVKISLFTILMDAVVLVILFHLRYPGQYDLIETAFKGAAMNLPALIFSAVVWIFTELLNQFLLSIRL